MANVNSSNVSRLPDGFNSSSSGPKNIPAAPDSIASRVILYPRSSKKQAHQATFPPVPGNLTNTASSASPIVSPPLSPGHSQWQGLKPPFTPTLSPVRESDHRLSISSTLSELNLSDEVTTGDGGIEIDWVEAGLPSPTPDTTIDRAILDSIPNPGTWIHPYGLAADTEVPRIDGRMMKRPNFAQCLANSGVDRTTRYPLSTSPRASAHDIHALLDMHAQNERRARVGGKLVESPQPAYRYVIDTSKMQFVPFSYDATFQPRTAAAREKEGEPVSPKTIPMGSEMSAKEREELAEMFVLDDMEE